MYEFIASLLLPPCAADDCLLPADSGGRDTPFSSDASPSLPNDTQAIITTYEFKCHGNITAWHAYIRADDPSPHVIHFQVWRPSSAADIDGCFALIGENVLSGVTAAGNGLISKIPQPDDIISVAPGDVVGYYAWSSGSDDNPESPTNATEILLDTSYTDEEVWYHTNTREDPLITSGPQTCPFPVGTNRILGSYTNAAPVLSIDMGKPQCTHDNWQLFMT